VIDGGVVEFDKQWYRCNNCTTVFHYPDAEHQECIKCESENIEHINQSIREWKDEKNSLKAVVELEEYCTCPHCGYDVLHQPGVPCFSLTCPDCKISLIRKR
jgi:hypothetical protein